MIKVAASVIIQDKKLLLVKQKNRDYWTPPGGLVDEGETPEGARLRETREEIGVEVEIVAPLKTQRRWWPKRNDFLEIHNFLVKIKSGKPRCVDNGDSGDVEDITWAAMEQFPAYGTAVYTAKLFLEGLVRKEAAKSHCQIIKNACAAVKNNKVLLIAHNRILPDEEFCEREGCVRKKLGLGGGRQLEHCSAVHAEANLIAQAARKGISLEGATLYVTTFPCSMCARSIAVSGIKKIVYFDNYVYENGREILESAGVELVKL